MAVIGRQGMESDGPLATGTTTSEPDFGTIGGVPTIDSANARLGIGRCLKFAAVNDTFQQSPAGLVLDRDYFYRVYMRPTGTPSAIIVSVMQSAAGGTLHYRLNLTTERKLALANNANTTMFTTAQAISTTEYTRVEIKHNVKTGGGSNSTIELRINGETVYSSAVWNAGAVAAAPTNFRTSMSSNTGGISLYVDDIAINDGTGETQSSWPGEGKIINLRPVADLSRVGWEAGGGATTDLWDALDGRPAGGKALAEQTNTSQIKDGNNNATDAYEAELQSYDEAGVTAADTLLLVRPIIRHGNLTATAANLTGLSMVSNPVIAEVTHNASGAQATNEPTGWITRGLVYSLAPTVTLETRPVLKIRKATATTHVMSVDQVYLQVEYVPGASISAPPATSSASALASTPTLAVGGSVAGLSAGASPPSPAVSASAAPAPATASSPAPSAALGIGTTAAAASANVPAPSPALQPSSPAALATASAPSPSPSLLITASPSQASAAIAALVPAVSALAAAAGALASIAPPQYVEGGQSLGLQRGPHGRSGRPQTGREVRASAGSTRPELRAGVSRPPTTGKRA